MPRSPYVPTVADLLLLCAVGCVSRIPRACSKFVLTCVKCEILGGESDPADHRQEESTARPRGCSGRSTRAVCAAPMARTALLLSALLSGLQSPAARAQVITFNRTAGEVEVGTCEGLKKHAELGLDVSIVVTDNLRCTETITLAAGVDVSIGSAVDESWLVAISENFSVADPTSINLLVNPGGSYLSLDQLSFVNEAGTVGSPGEVRAVWNEGTLDITGCSFEGLNYASQQDGGAVRRGGT